ncbi:MAG: gliding motility-associated C-terminal domain-containing protein [Muribaculaceae bacterium]|nr:gliding motility-associated C-terminal domain-containing protein [Muribaculaceae bacterium]
MNKRLVTLMVAALALLSASGQVNFTNVGQYPVIEVTPERSTGLDKIYVVYNTDGVGMSFNSSTGEPARWERFYYQEGSLVMESVPDIRWNGMATTLDKIVPNKGYKIDDGGNPFYCWVVNYADYYMSLNDMFIINDSPCSLLSFRVDGTAPKIPYSTLNGRIRILDREIKLTYNSLEWDDSTYWQEKTVVETFESLEDGIQVDQPLCNTIFTLSGDRFLEEWGIGESKESEFFQTQAVDCGTTAVQEDRGNNNEKGIESGLGGSAPVHIIFTGYPTDAVVYRVWEIATDPEFEDIILQYNQDEVDYTFNDAGTYYVRYRVANADGSCEAEGGEVYMVTVSESELVCPNIFSPGSTEGVNDIWKVSYKSLVEFHCWIYNRWGTLMYEYTDPGGGWDGTYHGKLVDTGVYYYVVTAKGSDGVKYKKRGDITILRYKKGASGTSGGGSVDTGGF